MLTKEFETLVRKNQSPINITDKEWFDLIEARRERFKACVDLPLMPFTELRRFKCKNLIREDMLWYASNVTLKGDKEFSLETQGIFFEQSRSVVERIPNSGYCSPRGSHCTNGTIRIWGFARSPGYWVLVTVDFVGVGGGYKNSGIEEAKTIEIVWSDLATIAKHTKETPENMWLLFGTAIKSLAEQCKLLHDQAMRVARLIENEELVLSLMKSK